LDIHKDIKDINPAKSKDLILNGVFLRESILWQDNILLINNKLIILVTTTKIILSPDGHLKIPHPGFSFLSWMVCRHFNSLVVSLPHPC